MFFVACKIVFMHTQTPNKNLVFLSIDAVDWWVYGILDWSMNVSGMIIDKGKPEVLWVKPVTVSLVHRKPHVVCLAMHTEQTPVLNISSFRTSLDTTTDNTYSKYSKEYCGFNSQFT